MDFAALRQRATRLMRSSVVAEPPLPPYAATLFGLAQVAVGDADGAAALVADVLLCAPANYGAAVRQLGALLPPNWLSWPGAAGPAEWLALRLRYEEANRLISILGEWTPRERLALALYLREDVRRDDLDAWLGGAGMAERLSVLVGSVGASLGLVALPGESPACIDVEADLVDADDSELGARARRHALGCAGCRARVAGLRRVRGLLRRALDVLFRADLPPHMPALITERRALARPRPSRLRPLAALCVALLLWNAVAHGDEPAAPRVMPLPPQNGRQLVEQALTRLDGPARAQQILHERFRVNSAPSPITIERWFDYRPPHRLRVTVSRHDRPAPLFDLVVNGPDRLAYLLDPGMVQPYGGSVRDPSIAAYVPLLSQLPAVGSFGALPIPQRQLDVTLLAESLHGDPTLLGERMWRGRPAHLLAARTGSGERMVMLIDRETLSVLDVRLMAADAAASTTDRVWEADVVELLSPRDVPASRFYLPEQTARTNVNPRQLFLASPAELDLRAAARQSVLAVPDNLPEAPLIAFIRNRSGLRMPVYQVYEGRWSTMLILSPTIIHAAPRNLDRRFDNGAYTVLDSTLPQTTLAEFALDAAPGGRMRLYLWHMLATDAEREAMVERALRSMVLINADTVDSYAGRFTPPSRPWTTRRVKG